MTSNSDSLQGEDNSGLEIEETGVQGAKQEKKSPAMTKTVSIDTDTDETYSHNSIALCQLRPAVSVQNACKSYKSNSGTPSIVLNHFNMTVRPGTIYSLLGASGCGKTTLLSCIVGLRHLNGGHIHVLGAKPGTKASGVPGKRVGYMPQEIALFGEFSIQETFTYYGRIYNMTGSQIKENIAFLSDFLNLPPLYRHVSTLSGGQQRRVSFSLSLIHNPELLLLDEPTVGLDAVLRQSIWNHLVKLVATGKTTVILTTHYMEEARQSNTVGVMRNGRLLVEDSPNHLFEIHKTNLLEDIVMSLCVNDGVHKNDPAVPVGVSGQDKVAGPHANSNPSSNDHGPNNWRKLHRASVVSIGRNQSDRMEQFQDSMNRIATLSVKNLLIIVRNITFLIFILLIPTVQVILVCLTVGGDPRDLKFGFINHELAFNTSCPNVQGCPLEDNYKGLVSCQFVNSIEKEFIEMIKYKDVESAVEDIKSSKIWGVLTFAPNYTASFKERTLYGGNTEMGSVLASRLHLKLDISNKQIESQLSKYFNIALAKMLRVIYISCQIPPENSEVAIHFHDPIYGDMKTNFKNYIAPSVLLGILFFFPLSSSGLNYITEKKQGTLERSMVAGVTTTEFMLAYSGLQLLIVVIQALVAFGVLIFVFDIQMNGPIMLAFSMAVLIGISGISAGFLLSLFCTEEIEAVMLSLGMFFPNLLLAGMVWPLEGMPITLQYMAYAFPCTFACETMRSVVTRGLGLSHPQVWPGFVITILWIVFYWFLFAVIHKAQSKP